MKGTPEGGADMSRRWGAEHLRLFPARRTSSTPRRALYDGNPVAATGQSQFSTASVGDPRHRHTLRSGAPANAQACSAVSWTSHPPWESRFAWAGRPIGRRRPVQVRRLNRASLRSLLARRESAHRELERPRSIVRDPQLLPSDRLRSRHVQRRIGVRIVGAQL